MKKPKRPISVPGAVLSAEATAWREKIISEYLVTDAGGLTLIQIAAESLDRMRQAQAHIRRHGSVVRDPKRGLCRNPAVGIEREARSAMLAALKQLNFDIED